MEDGPNSQDRPTAAAAQPPRLSLDDAIEYCIGGFGWRQFVRATLPLFAWFFDAHQIFITIFTDAPPKWTCRNSTLHGGGGVCTADSNPCHLPEGSWSWELPPHASIVSEWSLQCAGTIISGLPASAFLVGSLVGGILLTTMADSFLGRKNSLVLSCLLMSTTGLLATVSPNIWVYTTVKFFNGFGHAMAGTCALVLASELVARNWREKIGVIGFLSLGLGFLSLPIIAYVLRGFSWRLLYISVNVPCVIYSFLVYFVVEESPRWLFVTGRKKEFAGTLRRMAGPAVEKSELTDEFFENCVEWTEVKAEENIYTALRSLVRRKWALRRLAVVMAVGFGTGLAYFGMPLGLGNLSFNLYVGVGLNAVSEIVASLATFLVVGKLNRKVTLMTLTAAGGSLSVASVFVGRWKGLQIGLEMTSFFCDCTAFDVLVLYTIELFPTCVRGSAVAVMHEASLIGGSIGPVLAAVGRRNHLWSYGVFGATILICGLPVVWVPETRGKVLCDTLEEEEKSERPNDA
ncbi:organic cation/carnitine transporter 3-like [Andrographis paniculata]|uniref:organic cation/carnitine transporter 3-like n=1 Tax=Andrographis paniculata TaxID=175694 RepID=UPI0021E83BE2|nr:organic cation/carnitine transporter 3-like [Andrographis paniculata]